MHWIDPDHLPEVVGVVDQFLINPHGDADGFLMTDGLEVHVPPHLSPRLLREVQPGHPIRVRGVRPRGAAMIAAIALDTPAGRILDEGPGSHDGPAHHAHDSHHAVRKPMHVTGIVRQVIHGPKGEARGAVLEDRRIVRVPPHDADRFTDLLRPGAALSAHGEGVTTSFGTVIDARELGASAETMTVVGKKPKPHGPKKHGAPKPKPHEKAARH